VSSQLGSLAIVSGKRDIFEAPNNGVKAILIGNESGLTVTITMQGGGVEKTLYPGTLDWFSVKTGFSGTIVINPITILNNVSTWPASSLIFDAIGLNDPEDASMYPVSLNRSINIGNTVSAVSGTATAIVNDNNAAATSIIEAKVTGDAASAVSLTNDALFTLGSVLHPGELIINGLVGGVGLAVTGPTQLDGGSTITDGAGKLTLNTLQLLLGSLTRIAKAGPYAVDPVAAFVNHNLGAIPDYVFAISGAITAVLISITAEFATMTSTQVKLQSNTHLGAVYILSIKF
jgi:hypothetical protein